MPYKVGKKVGAGWQVLKKEGDRWVVVGHSQSKEEAEDAVKARYANKDK